MRALGLLVLLAPAAAHAGGFALAAQSAQSEGTAGAGVATVDSSSAWYAPSALADGGGLRLDASLVLARPSLEARALDGSWSAQNTDSWSTPPHIDASFARGNFAAGVSLGVPFGSGVTWPADWQGDHEIVATQLMDFRAAPFVAYSFGKLRVSAGLHVDAARLKIQRSLDFIDMDGTVAIDMDGRGVGGDASLFYRASSRMAFAAAYRSRTHIKLGGSADFTAPEAFSNKVPDQQASSELTLPDQFVAGGRGQVTPSYALLADVELTVWSTHDQTVIDFAQEQTPDVMQQDGWKNAVAVRAGGEWTRGRLALRHGVYVDQSPAPSDHLAPSSPDATRLGVTVGASWKIDDRFTADAFVEGMWLLRRESTDMEALAASYGGHATLAGLGLRYQRAK